MKLIILFAILLCGVALQTLAATPPQLHNLNLVSDSAAELVFEN